MSGNTTGKAGPAIDGEGRGQRDITPAVRYSPSDVGQVTEKEKERRKAAAKAATTAAKAAAASVRRSLATDPPPELEEDEVDAGERGDVRPAVVEKRAREEYDDFEEVYYSMSPAD